MRLLERLEPRQLLAAVTWNPVFTDPGGTYAAYHAEIANFITLCGNEWAALVPDDRTSSAPVTLTISVEFDVNTSDPGSQMSGASTDTIQVGTSNVFDQTVLARTRYGDAAHSTTDADLIIQPALLTNTLWFDPDPADRGTANATPIPAGKIDAYSAILHEMGHIFAFNGDRDYNSYQLLDPTYASTFDTFMTVGSDGNPYFTGPNAEAANGGQPVPLTPGNPYHVGNTTGPGTSLLNNLMNGEEFNYQQRYFIGPMEKAVLADVITAGTRPVVVPPADTPKTVTFTGAYSYTAASGALVAITLKNGGSGIVIFPSTTATQEDATSIQILATTKKSILTIASNQAVTLPSGLTVDAPIASFSTQTVTLGGTSVFAGAGILSVASLSSGSLTVGGALACTSATFGSVSGSAISLASAAKLATGNISTSTFTVAGGKSASYAFGTVNSSTLNLPASKLLTFAGSSGSTINSGALTSLIATGEFDSNLSVAGVITKATLASVIGGSISATGAIAALTVTGNFAGRLASQSTMGKLAFGSIVASTVASTGAITSLTATAIVSTALTAPKLTTLTVKSQIDSTTITASGGITTLTTTALTNSSISSGLPATPATFPTATPGFTNPKASIKTLKVTVFSNTLVIAPSLGTVSLSSVTAANNGTPFGFYSLSLASLTATNLALNLKKKAPYSTTSGNLAINIA
jgi:hypothetical protein